MSNAINVTADGIQLFNSSLGTFSTVELTAKGDILTHDGANYASLSVGADGQALTADSSQTKGLKYAAASIASSLIFISSTTASSSSSVDFTAFDNSTYSAYYFTYTNVVPGTDGDDMRALFSIDTGATWLSGNYRRIKTSLNSTSGSMSLSGSTSDSKVLIAVSLGGAAGEGLSGYSMYIPTANPGTSNSATLTSDCSFVNSSGYFLRNISTGSNKTTTVIDGLRFIMSTGNIKSGVFKMYGVKK